MPPIERPISRAFDGEHAAGTARSFFQMISPKPAHTLQSGLISR